MPLVRRVPKRGFHNRFALQVATVNVADLQRAFETGEEVTPETLKAKSLAKSRWDVLESPRRRRTDQATDRVGPPVQPVGEGKNRTGWRASRCPARQNGRAVKNRSERNRPRPQLDGVAGDCPPPAHVRRTGRGGNT